MKLRIVAFAALTLVAALSLGAAPELADVSPAGAADAHHCHPKIKASCLIPWCIPGDLECSYPYHPYP